MRVNLPAGGESVECIEIWELSRELNVSIRALRDLVRAGHLELRGEDHVTTASADELRWQLACARAGEQ